MKNNSKIAVVGGGLLGLSIAYKLSKKGISCTVFEKDKGFGGLASGMKYKDFYLEKFYHHWFRSDACIQGLVKELGLSEKIQWLESNVGVWGDGDLHDFSTSIDVLKFKLLSIQERIRLGLASFYLQNKKNYSNFENITALDWCNKYFGKKVTSVLWKPLLVGKFRKYADQVSMNWLWARIHDRSSSRQSIFGKEMLGYLDGGIQQLIQKLVQKLDNAGISLHDNTEILSHKFSKGKHVLTIKTNFGTKKQSFDTVISTIPGPLFLKVFQTDKSVKAGIKKVKYIGATCMILELKQKLMPYYWLNVVDTKLPFMAMVEHTNFVRYPNYDKHIVYIAKYVDTQDKLFHMSPGDLFKMYLPYLKQINSEFSSKWVVSKWLFKARFAQHIVDVGYKPPAVDTNVQGLYFLNFSQIYPHDRGMNYAVSQANDFVEQNFA